MYEPRCELYQTCDQRFMINCNGGNPQGCDKYNQINKHYNSIENKEDIKKQGKRK